MGTKSTGVARGDGQKFDGGKPMWDLLPYRQLGHIAQVLTFGAEKYGANSWQSIPDFDSRYFAALMRHLAAWKEGEKLDPESGIEHLAHAGCCLLFLMWHDDFKEVVRGSK